MFCIAMLNCDIILLMNVTMAKSVFIGFDMASKHHLITDPVEGCPYS